MRKPRQSACVWTMGNGETRFTGVSRPELTGITTLKKVQLIHAACPEIEGFEFHYPNEIDQANCGEIRKYLDGEGLATAMVTPNHHHHSVHRALSSAHAGERAAALERGKHTIDMAYTMGATTGPLSVVLWQGAEHYEPGAITYRDALNWYREGINALLAYDAEQHQSRVVFGAEAKPNEPGTHNLFQCDDSFLAFRGTVNEPARFKLNPETGHAEMVGLDPVQTLAFAIEQGALGHYHINTQRGIKFDTDHPVELDITRLMIVRELMMSGLDVWVGHDIQARTNYSAADNAAVVAYSVGNFNILAQLVTQIEWDAVSKAEGAGRYLDVERYLKHMLASSVSRDKVAKL